nr:lysine-rich arabinogalactan protein 19-like [Aegilops tauschii subsp. strangulata]
MAMPPGSGHPRASPRAAAIVIFKLVAPSPPRYSPEHPQTVPVAEFPAGHLCLDPASSPPAAVTAPSLSSSSSTRRASSLLQASSHGAALPPWPPEPCPFAVVSPCLASCLPRAPLGACVPASNASRSLRHGLLDVVEPDQHPLVGEPPPHASLRPGHHLPDALAAAARPPSPPCCWHPEAL